MELSTEPHLRSGVGTGPEMFMNIKFKIVRVKEKNKIDMANLSFARTPPPHVTCWPVVIFTHPDVDKLQGDQPPLMVTTAGV